MQVMNRNLVICPGFQKCGTTALFQIMDEQCDDVNAMSSLDCVHPKEIDFFCKELQKTENAKKKTIDWYENLLDDQKINLDSSPNYSMKDSNFIAKKISQYSMDVKFIFLLRNPIDRAFSAYNHYMQELPKTASWGGWNPKKSFLYNFFMCDSFTKAGFYQEHICNYLKYFKKDQFLFIISERLGSEGHQKEWNKIFDFICLDKFEVKDEYNIHKRKKPRKLGYNERMAAKDFYEDSVVLLRDLIEDDLEEWVDFKKS